VHRGSGVAANMRGCRVVTTGLTVRLLLSRQLHALDHISWSIVSGDDARDLRGEWPTFVIPIRREFALSDVGAFFRLLRLFRRERFDLVQTHTPKASFLGLPAARLAGSPSVYTVHGALYFRDNGPVANILGWLFERWCCMWAHLVLVQSREDEGVLPAARICPARKVRYVGNGVQLARFTEAVAPARRSDRPIVVMVSRLVREKGCRDYLALARALGDRAEFVHVGPAEHDQRDAITDAEMAAADSVCFVGAVEDVRPWLSAADVVVLPSYREGIPRVAMEAAAAGRPVLAYDVRGVREVLAAAPELLVRRGDTAALRTTLERLLADPQWRRAAGRACQVSVLERFSEDDVVDRLKEVYASLSAARRT